MSNKLFIINESLKPSGHQKLYLIPEQISHNNALQFADKRFFQIHVIPPHSYIISVVLHCNYYITNLIDIINVICCHFENNVFKFIVYSYIFQ